MANVYLMSWFNEEERAMHKYARNLFDLATSNARDCVNFPHFPPNNVHELSAFFSQLNYFPIKILDSANFSSLFFPFAFII